MGRFIQADSIIPVAGDSKSFDRYSYVNYNPIKYNDPTGHFINFVLGAIGGAIYGYGSQVVNNFKQGMNVSDAFTKNINTEAIVFYTCAGAAIGTLIAPIIAPVATKIAQSLTTRATVAAAKAATTTTAAVTTTYNATGGDPSDELKTVSNAATNLFGNLSKAGEYLIKPYNQLRNTLSNTGLQAHHIIEQRLAPALNQTVNQARSWSSVAVTPEEYQIFTNAWRSAIGYSNQTMELTTTNVTPQQIWAQAQIIYANYPALLDAARIQIFGN